MLGPRWFLSLTLAPALAASLWAVTLGPAPAADLPARTLARRAERRPGPPLLLPHATDARAPSAEADPRAEADGPWLLGRVVGPQGEPLADVALTLEFVCDLGLGRRVAGATVRRRSDPQGRFGVRVPADAGSLLLTCRAPDGYLAPRPAQVGSDGSVGDAPGLAPGPGVRAEGSGSGAWPRLVVQLDRRATISGSVATPLSCASATVIVSARWSRPLAADGSATTQARGGWFELEVPASAGPMTVCARPAEEPWGGGPAGVPGPFDACRQPVVVLMPAGELEALSPAGASPAAPDGGSDPLPPPAQALRRAPLWAQAFPAWAEGVRPGTSGLRLVLAPAPRTQLSVLDAQGAPCRVERAALVASSGAQVALLVRAPEATPGEWVLLGAPLAPSELVLSSGPAVGRLSLPAAGPCSVTLDCAALRGRLTGTGRPEGWRVQWAPRPGPPPGLYVCGRSPAGRCRHASPAAVAPVAPDGTFALEVEPGTRGVLWATCEADPGCCAWTEDVRAGAESVVLEVAEGRALNGRVHGLPVPGRDWCVWLERDGLMREALVAADGAFDVQGLAAGVWNVGLSRGGRRLWLCRAEPGGDPLELRLPAGGAAGRTDPR